MANTIIYPEDWATKLQERLTEPTKWKDVCNVEYTNSKVLHNPYNTDPVVQAGVRGNQYTYQDVVITDESVTIDTFKILPQFIDRADLAQTDYVKQMELADLQGILLNEAIETAFLADYASMTTFDNTMIGGGAGNITVSATNVDDIIRAVKRQIRKAKGQALAARNGIFIIWRPEDFELLEAFAQANGFNTADAALKLGIDDGFQYMNVTHYSSNFLTAGHLVAGVKKVYHLGIVQDTYGQIVVDDKDPDRRSGISVVSRVDFKGKVWTKVLPVIFNVTVA
jgi:hypothetical protein